MFIHELDFLYTTVNGWDVLTLNLKLQIPQKWFMQHKMLLYNFGD